MPRRRPGQAPKKRGRPSSKPRKESPNASNDQVITGTGAKTKREVTGSAAFRTADARLTGMERRWGVNQGTDPGWAEGQPTVTDAEFSDMLKSGRTNPEPVEHAVGRALGETGARGKEPISPARDRPTPSRVGPDVPNFEIARNPSKPTPGSGATERGIIEPAKPTDVTPQIAPGVPHPMGPQIGWTQTVWGDRPLSGTEHNVIPRTRSSAVQRRIEDAEIFERGVGLHRAIKGMMEGTRNTYHKPPHQVWLTSEDVAKEREYQKGMKARTKDVKRSIDLGIMRPQVEGENPLKTPVNPHDVPVWKEHLDEAIPRKQQVNPSKNTMKKFEQVKTGFNTYRDAFRKPGKKATGEYDNPDNGLPTDFGDWGHW